METTLHKDSSQYYIRTYIIMFRVSSRIFVLGQEGSGGEEGEVAKVVRKLIYNSCTVTRILTYKFGHKSLHADIADDVLGDWRVEEVTKDLVGVEEGVTLQEMVPTAITPASNGEKQKGSFSFYESSERISQNPCNRV